MPFDSLPYKPDIDFDIEATELLRTARDMIAKPYGWCRKSYSRGRIGYCSIGAIYAAAGIDAGATMYLPIPTPAISFALIRLKRASGMRNLSPDCEVISLWNDKQLDKRPVLAAFDKAIENNIDGVRLR